MKRDLSYMMRNGLILLLVVGWVQVLPAAEKRALLIGINDYTKGPAHWDLRGCENDVAMTRQLLVTKFSFPEENIKVLLSGEATAEAIKSAIEDWLVARSQPEDIVYFHFSGHGSQLKDRDGDEKDGRDEMICPADMEPGKIESIITDEQLGELLERIPANNVTVVLDACHSGTGTRDLTRSRARFAEFEPGVGPGTRSIVVSSAEQSIPSESSEQPATGATHKLSGSEGMEGGGELQVTISGCKDDQTSADAFIDEGFYAGALTYNLIENMKKAPPDMTYRELMDQVERDIKAGKYTQTPEIKGDMDRPLLGKSVPGMVETPFLVIQAVEGTEVTLSGGKAQKVTQGSVYGVFREDETLFAGSGLGRIRVEEVFPTSARAVILDRISVKKGYRVKELLRNLDPRRLKLLVEDGGVGLKDEMVAALAPIDFVETVAADQYFDHRLQISAGLGGWQAALTVDGVAGTTVSGTGAGDLVESLRPTLENAYTIKVLAALDNPSPPFRVKVWANHVVLEEKGLKKLDEAPDEKLVEARVGDSIRFNFRADRDCYLTLINVGSSGKIAVLFPNQYQPDGFIEKGRTYRTETPREMPFKIRATGPVGRGLVKVIATLEPLELESLRMGEGGGVGTRSIASGSSFARQLTRDLAQGGETAGVLLLPTDTWTTDYLIVETRE